MLVLGIILVLLATGAVLAALFGASAETSTFDLGAFTLEMSTLGVFFLGAATVFLLGAGLALMQSGVRRANRRRKDKKELNRLSHKLEEREGTSTGSTSTPRDPDTPGSTPPSGTTSG